MAKVKSSYVCSECGWTSTKWVGQCRKCDAWGTLEEFQAGQTLARKTTAVKPATAAKPIEEVSATAARAHSTGVPELDRVLGGGIVPGAVVLMAGEPGVGKSTLLLDVAARAATQSDQPVLYLTGEESASQVRLRAERIGALHPNLYLASENDLSIALGHIEQLLPSLVIVDSVQTFATAEVEGAAGGLAQVRAVAAALISVAKQHNIPVLLVGHVTKDGGIAGPRILEHLVDVVCQFEGDRHARLRLLRAVKNRYGPTDEVGCFELGEGGIIGLADPSGLFLSNTGSDVPGSCITVTLEGRRPMPIEVQALVAPSGGGSARRTTSGLDYSRVAMSLAVLQARMGLSLSTQDVYVSTVGGAKTTEPAIDLAVALAVVSACQNTAMPRDLMAVGEVGLTGEVRATVGLQRRLAEGARLGLRRALIPRQGPDEITAPKGLQLIPVDNLAQAVTAVIALTVSESD